jgi:hypothetical protein
MKTRIPDSRKKRASSGEFARLMRYLASQPPSTPIA